MMLRNASTPARRPPTAAKGGSVSIGFPHRQRTAQKVATSHVSRGTTRGPGNRLAAKNHAFLPGPRRPPQNTAPFGSRKLPPKQKPRFLARPHRPPQNAAPFGARKLPPGQKPCFLTRPHRPPQNAAPLGAE